MFKSIVVFLLLTVMIIGVTVTHVVQATSNQTIEEMIAGKYITEKANIKGQEIARLVYNKKYIRKEYEIEIIEVKEIEGGVAVFARVWNSDGAHIGFGKDGSVDIERFRIFNPPILVEDPQGTYIREWLDGTGKVYQRIYREDPEEALLQVLEHTIYVKKQVFDGTNIIHGKIGNTTSVFFPAAGANDPVDGYTIQNNETWTTAHDAADGSSADDTGVAVEQLVQHIVSTNLWHIKRGLYLFDTSTIDAGDSIDSATFSAYGATQNDTINDANSFLALVQSSPASNTSITTADYDQFGTTTGGTANVDLTTWSTSAYNDFTLNPTGLTWIGKGIDGRTRLGLREGHDLNNSPWTPGGSNEFEEGQAIAADNIGTSQDPKLVVEHSGPAPIISNIHEIAVTETSATIKWDTDISSDSKVSYGISAGNYTNSTSTVIYATNHSIYLTNLDNATNYYYIVVSANTEGKVSTSTEQSFATLTPGTLIAYKNSNQSIATTTDVFANEDSELVLALSTSTTYAISGTIFATSTHTLPDIKIGFATSSAWVTMDIGYIASDGTGGWLEYSGQESAKIDVPSTGASIIQITGTLKTTSMSTVLRLHWAQNASRSENITVKRGSYLRAEAVQ